MKHEKIHSFEDVLKLIAQGRERTNILRKYEQPTLAYLVQRVPAWITSNMLTGVGLFGNIIIFLSFVLAVYCSRTFLLLGVLGFFINWLGDSLDGRLAYYRNKQRKWYGFSLDITIDWVGIIFMGWGFVIYAQDQWEIIGFAFVVLYGWEIITALLRYKISGKYSIDSGLLGPTEVRIVISLILVLEVLVKDSILYSSIAACVFLFIANMLDSRKLMKLANERDKQEKETKTAAEDV